MSFDSDSEDELPSNLRLSDDYTLTERIGYPSWEIRVRLLLITHGLLKHITKTPSEIETSLETANPPSSPSSSSPPSPSHARIALAAARRRLEHERYIVCSVLYFGLSKNYQASLPWGLLKWSDPQPKALYDHIKATYGANVGSGPEYTRLWAEVLSNDLIIRDPEDPLPKLAIMERKWGQILMSVPSDEVRQYVLGLAPHAILRNLPESLAGVRINLMLREKLDFVEMLEAIKGTASLMMDIAILPKAASASRPGSH
ncbi:uncharacterized protein MKK02DRAFT_38914 [Dioszegia hungarica]|uniref:Uncharacterized protein n=1 Tax=Dioszegia hungarica TaxID=4972 RepID=A0AA38H595_9TREE|nr:uncharacterized protein MKK02DRAFT_38914 [Dioszegia hungarica]KAI9634240.1 hypothetical protein MKK02DRAFT_38914 [Dioszegia hungarica]